MCIYWLVVVVGFARVLCVYPVITIIIVKLYMTCQGKVNGLNSGSGPTGECESIETIIEGFGVGRYITKNNTCGSLYNSNLESDYLWSLIFISNFHIIGLGHTEDLWQDLQ